MMEEKQMRGPGILFPGSDRRARIERKPVCGCRHVCKHESNLFVEEKEFKMAWVVAGVEGVLQNVISNR